MVKYVVESEMKFGPFEENMLLPVEKIPQYQAIQQGMHMSEFIFYDSEKKHLISLEAKKSAPNPNSDKAENPAEVFLEYINTIREKFENSLDLYANLALKNEIPDGFEQIDYKDIEVLFVLVIKNHEKKWLKDVKDALEMSVRKVHRTNKIWKCKVVVINEEIAKQIKLIEDAA